MWHKEFKWLKTNAKVPRWQNMEISRSTRRKNWKFSLLNKFWFTKGDFVENSCRGQANFGSPDVLICRRVVYKMCGGKMSQSSVGYFLQKGNTCSTFRFILGFLCSLPIYLVDTTTMTSLKKQWKNYKSSNATITARRLGEDSASELSLCNERLYNSSI